MIKLGHVKDIDTISAPSCIINEVKEDLESLDYHYGENRDIDKAEYSETIGQYQKSLYISGTERNIIIYRCLNDERMLQK